MIRAAALAAALLAMAGCEPQKEPVLGTSTHASRVVAENTTLFVTHDRVNGVTCWSKGEKTLSCLPDWMLDNQAAMIFGADPQ